MSEKDQESTGTVPPKPPKYVTQKFMITTVAVFLILLVVSLLVYDRYFATKIIVYDLPGKLILIKKAAEEGKITFQQAEQISALEIDEAKKISDAAPSNYIVLSGDAVIPKSGDAALGNHASKIGR